MELLSRISQLVDDVRKKQPLVHHITNYVTVNDCANMALAVGGSPVMADEIEEVEDMVSIANALVINMGTLNKRTVESMLAAGKKANELGIPVIFDPVGVGATRYRTLIAQRLIEEIKFTVIRGNISEIKAISGVQATTRGVDASEEDSSELKDGREAQRLAQNLSRKLGCVVAITGAVDTISNGEKTFSIHNGHPMLSKISGTGCMCTTLIGVCCGATDDFILGAAAGVLIMDLAGERAYESLDKVCSGVGSFKVKLMDQVSRISGQNIVEGAKIYEV
jgi:hydroxyethylthiazole kinase